MHHGHHGYPSWTRPINSTTYRDVILAQHMSNDGCNSRGGLIASNGPCSGLDKRQVGVQVLDSSHRGTSFLTSQPLARLSSSHLSDWSPFLLRSSAEEFCHPYIRDCWLYSAVQTGALFMRSPVTWNNLLLYVTDNHNGLLSVDIFKLRLTDPQCNLFQVMSYFWWKLFVHRKLLARNSFWYTIITVQIHLAVGCELIPQHVETHKVFSSTS